MPELRICAINRGVQIYQGEQAPKQEIALKNKDNFYKVAANGNSFDQ
jgi:hypothetical protein